MLQFFLFMTLSSSIFAAEGTAVRPKPQTEASVCETCTLNAGPKTAQNLLPEKTLACKELAESSRCRSAYEQIERSGGNSDEYKKACSAEELKNDEESFFLSGQKIYGCGAGVGDAVIGDFARSLGQGVAKMVTDFEINSYCDKHVEYKKMLYLSHNLEVPKDLQVKIPEDKVLQAYSCSDLRRSIYEEGRGLLTKKQRDAEVKYPTVNEGLGLLHLSRNKLKEIGIEIECYNPKKSIELICKTTSYLAVSLAVPVAAVYKLRTAAGLLAEANNVEIANDMEAGVSNDWSNSFFEPINVPAKVNSRDVAKSATSEIKNLKKLGVRGHETNVRTALQNNVETFKRTQLKTKAGKMEEFGIVYEIDRLPAPGTATGPGTNAFLHPQMADYRTKLEAMNCRLVVDTSISHTGVGAYFSETSKVLALKSDSTWQIFLHEFQHAEFDYYIKPRWRDLTVQSLSPGKSVTEVLPGNVVETLGKERVARLDALIKKGLPQLAVNETLSVDEELKVMGFRRYIPAYGSVTEKYALRHQITELNRLAVKRALNPMEAKTLNQAKVKYAALTVYDAGTITAAIAGPGFPALESAAIYKSPARPIPDHTSDPNSYIQIIYDEKGYGMAQKSDGKWEILYQK